MIRKISRLIAVVFACVGLVLLVGCAEMGSYGRLNPVYSKTDGISIQIIMERWQDFDIYYAGLSTQNPSAVIFDPKGDGKKIVTDKWILLEDKERISEAVHWISKGDYLNAVLYKIIGPDDQPYGYMYTAWNHVYMKLVDENTLWVEDLPLPPIDYGPGFSK
jgi:hypothetical protein